MNGTRHDIGNDLPRSLPGTAAPERRTADESGAAAGASGGKRGPLLPLSRKAAIGIAGGLALAATLLGLASGAAPLHLGQLLAAATGGGSPLADTVLFQLRLPRVLLGLLVGASLASCGAGVQALFRNPLAEPGLIGISAGAAVGAAVVFTLLPNSSFTVWLLPAAAFLGAALCTIGIVKLAARDGATRISTLLLAGLALNAIAGGAVALLATLGGNTALRNLSMWLFGSLGRASWPLLTISAPFMLLPCVWLPFRARALDALLLGEAEAGHLGVGVERLKREILVTVVLGTGAAVAVSGVIGFVGLLMPHLVRLIAGPRHAGVLTAGALFGAALLVGADTAGRTLLAPTALPVGVLTALIGGPLFLVLLARTSRHAELM
ncbi:MAG TPA: iron ABC transporter permease [Nevskiaceae bacterium]|nr:iron ABC transporter permease [Nevskiaceae bacterium]